MGWGLIPNDFAEKVARALDQRLLASTRRQNAFALGGGLDDRALGRLPLHADPFDAEIVLRIDTEEQLLRIEHDLDARQVLAGQCGRLVIARADFQRERLLAA